MSSPARNYTPERTVLILEHFSSRICADTGMSRRDLECLIHLVQSGSFDATDLEAYGIKIYVYAPSA